MTARKEQGWINYNRKPIFFAFTVGILAYWFLTNPAFITFDSTTLLILRDLGIFALVIGVVGRVFSTMSIGGKKNETVVKTEMYSIVRHPLYFSSMFLFIGAGLLIGRIDVFVLLMASFYFLFYSMMINEEKFLLKMFGKEYEKYMKETPRLLPKLSKFKCREYIEVKTDRVIKTFMDGSLAFLIIPLIDILNYLKTILL